MLKKTITIGLSSGLEARPVAMLVQIASQFDSQIYVENNNARVNAKSIMGMMTLGMGAGERLPFLLTETMRNEALDNIEKILKGREIRSYRSFPQKLVYTRDAEAAGWK